MFNNSNTTIAIIIIVIMCITSCSHGHSRQVHVQGVMDRLGGVVDEIVSILLVNKRSTKQTQVSMLLVSRLISTRYYWYS